MVRLFSLSLCFTVIRSIFHGAGISKALLQMWQAVSTVLRHHLEEFGAIWCDLVRLDARCNLV